MAGDFIPAGMIPRFTTLVGATTFYTIGMDVSRYESGLLSAWRGPIPAGCTFLISCQESSDGEVWAACGGTNHTNVDPGANTEVTLAPTFTRRLYRVKVALAGTDPSATCWVAGGFLERAN